MKTHFKIFYNKSFATKIVSVIVAILILLSSMISTLWAFALNNNTYWDGSTTIKPTNGVGTETNPYLIEKAEHLAWAIQEGWSNYYYKLTNDIYLNDVNKINWSTGEAEEGYTPKQWYSRSESNTANDRISKLATTFGGNIDGDGHIVYGLYYDGLYYAGLIPMLAARQTITVKNLGIDKAYLKTTGGRVAALIGDANGADQVNISNSYVGLTVTVNGENASPFYAFGGATLVIENCYSLASVKGTNVGLIANTWSTNVIKNTYATVKVGAVNPQCISAENVYTTEGIGRGETVTTAWNMQGLDALTNKNKMPNLGTAFKAMENHYPILKIFYNGTQGGGVSEEDPTGGNNPSSDLKFWDGTVAESYAEGDGTENNPYMISTGAELARAVSQWCNRSTYFKLKNDIYLNDVDKIDWITGKAVEGYAPKQWFSRPENGDQGVNIATYFYGTLDGDGFTVYGMYYDGANFAGLISILASGTTTVKNLAVNNAYVKTTGGRAAALIGDTHQSSEVNIYGCYIGDEVIVDATNAGAFYGFGGATLNMNNCYSLASFKNSAQYGLYGDSWANSINIKNTYVVNAPVSTKQSNPNCTNVYTTQSGNFGYGTSITNANMQGQDVFTNNNKMPNLNSEAAFLPTAKYPVLKVFSKEVPDVSKSWDGTILAPTGEGTATNPIEISTPNQLAYIIKNGGEGKHYKLTADIYFNDIEKIDWDTGEKKVSNYVPNIWYTDTDVSDFFGTINGNGHIVHGIYYSGTNDVNVGLIPKTCNRQNVTIECLGIDDVFVSTIGNASALISEHNATATVSKAFVGKNVHLKGKNVGVFFANGGGAFEAVDCYGLAMVTAAANKGFFGDNWAGSLKISNVYLAKNIVISTKYNPNIIYSNVYVNSADSPYGACMVVSDDNMKGLDVFSNETKMPNLRFSGNFQQNNSYPILKIFSDDPDYDPNKPEGDIWSGRVANKFASGLGTEKDPYIISNGAELAYAIMNDGFDGSYFKIAKDIYLNNVSTKDWGDDKDNNKWITNKGFNGHIDGCGNIVYGIWYADDTVQDNAGLIPVFCSGTLKNIGVRHSIIRAKVNAGAIVGQTKEFKSGTTTKRIDSCFADETVNVKYTSTQNGGASGIVGQAGYEETYVKTRTTTLYITNCYSKAMLSGHDTDGRVNGVIGTSWMCNYEMNNCYSVNYAPYNGVNEWVCSYLFKNGVALDMIYKNIYTDQRIANNNEIFEFVTIDNMCGKNAKTYMPGLDYENTFEIIKGSTPKLRVFKSITGENVDLSGDAENYASGKGTEELPYIISNANQLKYLLQSKNSKGKYYELSDDIYINDVSKFNWYLDNPFIWFTNKNSETFMGVFDGKGHTINGLFLNETPTPYKSGDGFAEGSAGLFPKASTTATVRNVHIRNSNISANGYAGSIVGKIKNTDNGLYLKLIGCSADETVKVSAQVVGGLIGGGADRGLKLHYSYFTGVVTATAEDRNNSLVGDIWGYDWEMLQCYFTNYNAHRASITPNIAAVNYGDCVMNSAKYLTREQMTGEKARTNMKDFEWDNIWYSVEAKTPQLKVISKDWEMKIFDEGQKGRIWSGYVASKYSAGIGTKSDPYIIETPEQLAYLIDRDKNTEGKYYKLDADIKLNDTSSRNWEETAREWLSGSNVFKGHFNGNGHVISGMYYDTAYANAGLFQHISSGVVIEKVGITKATIKNKGTELNASYTGSLASMVVGWDLAEFTAPVIDQCFADHSVYIDGYTVGGLIGGNGMYIKMSNCYFTGELKGEDMSGQAVGNTWNIKPTYISNSYFLSIDASPLSDNLGAASIILENVYIRGKRGIIDGAQSIGTMLIRGESARKYMPKLDYENIWLIVKDGNPVLRCFVNPEKYSCKDMPEKVEISFATFGGSQCESIFGYPLYDELKVSELPIPTRYGYEFGGWCYFSDCWLTVEDGLFPDYNTVFYAKWTPVGFTVDFEKDLDKKYDFNGSAEHYKPGITGYNTRYVNGGLKAMHTKSADNLNPKFLLSYENTLEVGQIYTVTFFTLTDDTTTDTTLKLIHANHPQVDSDVVGYETVKLSSLTKGKYKQFRATFTANSPYLLFETEQKTSLYFDDVQVVPLGKAGETEKTITNASAGKNKDYFVLKAVIIIVSVIVIAFTITAVAVAKKKKSKII